MSLDFLNPYALTDCLQYISTSDGINHFPQMKSGKQDKLTICYPQNKLEGSEVLCHT
jgi:hypothetical protein